MDKIVGINLATILVLAVVFVLIYKHRWDPFLHDTQWIRLHKSGILPH